MKTSKQSNAPVALAALLILGSGAWLYAQSSQDQTEQTTRVSDTRRTDQIAANQSGGQPAKVNKGSSLIGSTVKNEQGEDLGKVRDIVLDFNTDRVAYVVLGSDSGLLSSEKLHAVPLRAFKPDAGGTFLVLNADKAKLESAAGFDKNNWPALGTATLGAEPFWKDTDSNGSYKRNDLDNEQYRTNSTLRKMKDQSR